mmetsp:Transcript_137941/g.358364  ORF Transcript_137941/g.358364 Transcript_137941/m.358364 type:complete len:251 (-) Transcript_137941:163-915(-)
MDLLRGHESTSSPEQSCVSPRVVEAQPMPRCKQHHCCLAAGHEPSQSTKPRLHSKGNVDSGVADAEHPVSLKRHRAQEGHCSSTKPCANSHASSLPLNSRLASHNTRSRHVANSSLYVHVASQSTWLPSGTSTLLSVLLCEVVVRGTKAAMLEVDGRFVVVASVVAAAAIVVTSATRDTVVVLMGTTRVVSICSAGKKRVKHPEMFRVQVVHVAHCFNTKSCAALQLLKSFAKMCCLAHSMRALQDALMP